MSSVVIASNNPGKLREFGALFATIGFDAVAQNTLGVGDAEEPHATFVENALVKARHASAGCGLAALADDSGLCVAALHGQPGVRSARYASGDERIERAEQDRRNNRKLVDALAGETLRDAYFLCCLVFVRHAEDPEPVVATGRWHGQFIDEPRGHNGFGYDPHFLVPRFGCTAAELDLVTKNRVSHRARALERLLAELRDGGLVPP